MEESHTEVLGESLRGSPRLALDLHLLFDYSRHSIADLALLWHSVVSASTHRDTPGIDGIHQDGDDTVEDVLIVGQVHLVSKRAGDDLRRLRQIGEDDLLGRRSDIRSDPREVIRQN